MTYQNYEFTAFSEADFGVGNVACGDTFTMPGSATACFNVSDNDPYLSGDRKDNSADHYGQKASIEGPDGELGNGGQVYAESYFWVSDQDGNWYVMIEIEQEGSNEDYFSFYTGGSYSVPPEGAVLTVGNSCNVDQSNTWLDMKCLDAGDKAEPEGTGAICGRLTEDADCDNTEFAADGGYDEGLGGQTVELYGWNGSSSYLVTTTTTNADGSYDFPGLDGGWYYVQFPEIDGGEFAAKGVGVEHADSDANAWGRTDWICLDDGQVQLNIDASVKFPVETGSISGTVFCDINCDGLQGSEVVIEGCDYTIEAESMDLYGFQSVSGAQASDDCLVRLKCLGGWGDLTTTFGGKTGVYDVKIRVQDEDDGQSIIKLKVDGQFVEAIRLDADTDGGGSDDGGFSTYVIKDVPIASGEDITLWVDGDDGEYVRIDKIDLVGQDEVVTEAEPVKEGVEIKLIDADGTVIETTYTDADGNYAFNDIPVGDYSIMGVAPDGTEFTFQNVGSDDSIDSDVDGNGMSGTVTVTADGNADIDLGLKDETVELGALEGRYFCDEDGNNVDDGEAGVEGAAVWLLKGGVVIKSTTTDADGNYAFSDLEAGDDYSVRFEDPNGIGQDGKVFVTANVGNDQDDSDVTSVGGTGNGNTDTVSVVAGETTSDVDAGIQDPGTAALEGRYFCDENDDDIDNGEPGISGALVTLLDGNNNPVLDGNGNPVTTTTDGNGNYAFTGLAAGTYGVLFAADADGKTFVAQNDPNGNGDDTNDSDVDGGGVISGITLEIGETSSDNDAGVEDPGTASIGDKVFIDANGNGQQDDGEIGVDGVTVTLTDANGNETTQITQNGGMYLFTGLDAGDYTVGFEEVDGFDFTTANAMGVDDDKDSDADETTGVTGTISLEIGEADLTVDAGLVVENTDPEAMDDLGEVCATEITTINVLANDTDADSDTLSVATVNGEDLAAGESTTLASGATVTLNADGTLSYDSANAIIGGQPVSDLLIHTTAMDSFSYTVTDGNGGTSEADVSVTLKGGFNTVETILSTLPTTGIVSFQDDGGPEAFTATLSGTGNADLDGLVIEAAYCLERDAAFISPDEVLIDISGALDSIQSQADFVNTNAGSDLTVDGNTITTGVEGNLDLINWIINQDFTSLDNGDGTGETYTDAEVQHAIWGITDNNSQFTGGDTANGTQDNVQEILSAALENGEGFEAGEGDLLTLVLNPFDQQPGTFEFNDHDQSFIIALPFDEYKEDCIC